MSITIEEMQKQVHNLAKEKGWWPFVRTEEGDDLTNKINLREVNIPEKLMLMVSELGEALEFYRGDEGLANKIYTQIPDPKIVGVYSSKPDGFWVELADCVIRILDLAGAYDIDMEELIKEKHTYNKTRPYRHGNKKC